jgi:hypothetical protein
MRRSLVPAVIVLIASPALAGPAIYHMPAPAPVRATGLPPAIPLPHPGGRSLTNPGDPLAPPPRVHRPRHRGGGFAYGWPHSAPVEITGGHHTPTAPHLRSVRPLSFNVIDPAAVVGRTRSGRVVVYGTSLPATAASAPYAPPSVQIIGIAPSQHMRGRMHLTHGVAAPRGLDTAPRVIWLKDHGGEKGPFKDAE